MHVGSPPVAPPETLTGYSTTAIFRDSCGTAAAEEAARRPDPLDGEGYIPGRYAPIPTKLKSMASSDGPLIDTGPLPIDVEPGSTR